MRSEDVDCLRLYLEAHPEVSRQLRDDPPGIRLNGRWYKLRDFQVTASSIVVSYGRHQRAVLPLQSARALDRRSQRQFLMAVIRRTFPAGKVGKTLDATDRRRHQTGEFIRVVITGRKRRYLVVGAYPDAHSDLSNRLLVSALLWYQQMSPGSARLALFVPNHWEMRLDGLLQFLELPVTVHLYDPEQEGRTVAASSPGRSSSIGHPYVIYPFQRDIPQVMREAASRWPELDLLFRKDRWELCYRGFPVLWSDGGQGVQFNFLQPRTLRPASRHQLSRHVRRVIEIRRAETSGRRHPYFRESEERWLESVVLRNLTAIFDRLTPSVYCQVPTFIGGHRLVMDILGITRSGRLAVFELKTSKNLSFLLQGLDYAQRVFHHARQGDFQRAGYFQGQPVRAVPPLLYLVTPLFQIHETLPEVLRCFRNLPPIELVGINTDWKKGLTVLRKCRLSGREESRY